jgi:1,4-dihydroxy-2-naphthoate octaprenyltransferase
VNVKRVFEFFLYSSLYMAVCAVIMITQTNKLFHLQYPKKDFYFFVSAATICSYNFHWWLTPRTLPGSERIQWTDRHRHVLLGLAIAGLIAVIFFFIPLRQHWLPISVAMIATFLYSAPKIPHGSLSFLRKIAIGKTIFLAFVWMYVTSMLPILISGSGWSVAHTIYCISRFFLIYAICILFDFRDREEDKKQGIKSLITYLSEKNVMYLFIFSLVVFFVSTMLLLSYHISSTAVIVLLFPGLITAMLYDYSQTHYSDTLYYFVLDGLMMLSALVMLFIAI